MACHIDRNGPVQISFFGVPEINQIENPFIASDYDLKIASLVDLAGMKASVVQKRAEAKDYIDINAIIQHGYVDLPMALAAGRHIYGQNFNPEITLKALSYYGDGNLKTLPRAVRDRLSVAEKTVDLDRLPVFEHGSISSSNDLEQ